MTNVLMERDTTTGSTYYQLVRDAKVDHTRSVSDLIMVDLDASGQPVGVEFAMNFRKITAQHQQRLVDAFPDLKAVFPDVRSLVLGPDAA